MSAWRVQTGDPPLVTNGEMTFPLQVVVWLLREHVDSDVLVPAYRSLDPTPEAQPYPGRAWLGTPEGQELGVPFGWTADGLTLRNGDFEARVDGTDLVAGWPDYIERVDRAVVLGWLGLDLDAGWP